MTRLRISAVIPCYNGAAFLEEALRSVLAQTRAPDEILVVDDGSTDDSASIARRAGATCITLAQNSGPGAARNHGISRASGDLIAFLDADDFWMPTHLADVASLLERYPESPVAFSRIHRFGDDDLISPASIPAGAPTFMFWQLIEENIVAQSAAVVRRETLLQHGGYNAARRYSEDYELWLRLARHHSFVCTNAVTAGYRVHPQQATHDVVRMLHGRWDVKHQFWREATVDEPRAFVQQLEHLLLHVWKLTLKDAWWERDGTLLAAALSLHDLVPHSAASFRRWSWRVRLGWRPWLILGRVWERLPRPAQELVRPSLTALLGPDDASDPPETHRPSPDDAVD